MLAALAGAICAEPVLAQSSEQAPAQQRGRGRGRGVDAEGRRGEPRPPEGRPQARPPETRGVPRLTPPPQRPGRSSVGPWRPQDRRTLSQEPAFARGYADGVRNGAEDGRERARYDPVGHRDYRDGDQGYAAEYGSRDAYRNNYRAGFRQGYDEGYRDGSRGR